MSRSRAVSTHDAVKRAPVRSFTTVTRSPAASAARRPGRRSRSSRSIGPSAAGSSKTRGTMPQLIRFDRWMRANDFTMTARTPRYIGPVAAASRDDP